jgi:hypothetical protein
MRKYTLFAVLVAFVLSTIAPTLEAAAVKKAPTTTTASKTAKKPKKPTAKKVKKKKKHKKRRVRRSGTHWIRTGFTQVGRK